jgi:glucokinase
MGNKIKITGNAAIIGVDVGGTKIKTGMVSFEGKLLCDPVTVATGGKDEKEKIYGRIAGTIETVIKRSGIPDGDIAGIGLGVTGPLDLETGTILECPQLPTMHFFPLKERISKDFPFTVTMDNDANALILGESVWGAGKGNDIVLGYTLGTGLGCAR